MKLKGVNVGINSENPNHDINHAYTRTPAYLLAAVISWIPRPRDFALGAVTFFTAATLTSCGTLAAPTDPAPETNVGIEVKESDPLLLPYCSNEEQSIPVQKIEAAVPITTTLTQDMLPRVQNSGKPETSLMVIATKEAVLGEILASQSINWERPIMGLRRINENKFFEKTEFEELAKFIAWATAIHEQFHICGSQRLKVEASFLDKIELSHDSSLWKSTNDGNELTQIGYNLRAESGVGSSMIEEVTANYYELSKVLESKSPLASRYVQNRISYSTSHIFFLLNLEQFDPTIREKILQNREDGDIEGYFEIIRSTLERSLQAKSGKNSYDADKISQWLTRSFFSTLLDDNAINLVTKTDTRASINFEVFLQQMR